MTIIDTLNSDSESKINKHKNRPGYVRSKEKIRYAIWNLDD